MKTGGVLVVCAWLSHLTVWCGSLPEDSRYVSLNGRDGTDCGFSSLKPCRSLRYAYETSYHSSPTIFIDGFKQDGLIYEVCSQSSGTRDLIIESVELVGHNGVPIISCDTSHLQNSDRAFTGKHIFKHRLIFESVTVRNAIISLTDVDILITNSSFENVSILSGHQCNSLSVTVSDSEFTKVQQCPKDERCSDAGNHRITCSNITIDIDHSQFWDINVAIVAFHAADIVISDSLFSKKINHETGLGGLNITLPISNGYLKVQRCTFSKQVHYDPVLSAINIEAAALRIESNRFNLSPILETYVEVINCTFMKNERALSISRPFLHVLVQGSIFDGNKAMHAAAALRLAVGYNVKIIIQDCLFINNYAGSTDHSNVPGKFSIDGEQVRVNNEQYKGVISLVGKGGAVRIQKGNVIIVNCTFTNNTARLLGGAIFVDRGSHLTLIDSQMEGPDSQTHAMQGDILYSSGNVKVASTSFVVKSSLDHVTILRHSGKHWSMNVESLWFECPTGHRVMLINTTSHRIENNVGLKRSHKLDQLSYYCQTCGDNQYSLEYGYINYTLLDNKTEYFTLLINGEEPFRSHSVDFDYKNISCHNCPYGASCDGKIAAVPNFWGYKTGEHASFQHCPPDYCCSSTKCDSMNSCAENREGELCGRCRRGYTEALFSSKCVLDKECDNHWLWPFTLSMGFLYAMFLVFQKEMRDFMFAWSFDFNEFNHLCCHQKLYLIQYLTNNSLKMEDRKTDETIRKHDHMVEEQFLEENNLCQDPTINEKEEHEEKSSEAGFLITMFYYFQDALLLHIDTIYTRTTSKFEKQLKAFLVGLFRFQIDFYQFLDHVCIFSGLHPVPKQLFKSLFVPYILILFGLFYFCYKWFLFISKRRSQQKDIQKRHLDTFSTKLACGFILAMLFTYQKMATATFTLLNCVPIGNNSVLFIDGTQKCFQPWQYGAMFYAFTCVVPFSMILMLGPPLLKQGYISLGHFFLGCLCPLPSLVHWIIVCSRRQKERKVVLHAESLKVLEILQAPFKESRSVHIIGQLCWSGVLIGRRLILFLCFTFINDVLVRLLCMLGVCFIILMHHMYVQPYKTAVGNLAGTMSAAALLIVGGINLLRASFESAEYRPQGPNRFLMEIFEELENTLVLWLPLAGMCLILLVLCVKLLLTLVHRLHGQIIDTQKVPSDHVTEASAPL